MSTNPYENEPGFENKTSPEDKKSQKAYVQKVRGLPLYLEVPSNEIDSP